MVSLIEAPDSLVFTVQFSIYSEVTHCTLISCGPSPSMPEPGSDWVHNPKLDVLTDLGDDLTKR
jgi:hypothetical protein